MAVGLENNEPVIEVGILDSVMLIDERTESVLYGLKELTDTEPVFALFGPPSKPPDAVELEAPNVPPEEFDLPNMPAAFEVPNNPVDVELEAGAGTVLFELPNNPGLLGLAAFPKRPPDAVDELPNKPPVAAVPEEVLLEFPNKPPGAGAVAVVGFVEAPNRPVGVFVEPELPNNPEDGLEVVLDRPKRPEVVEPAGADGFPKRPPDEAELPNKPVLAVLPGVLPDKPPVWLDEDGNADLVFPKRPAVVCAAGCVFPAPPKPVEFPQLVPLLILGWMG